MFDYFQDQWRRTNPHKTGKHIETTTTGMGMEAEELLPEIMVFHSLKTCFTYKEPVDLQSLLFHSRVKVQELGVIWVGPWTMLTIAATNTTTHTHTQTLPKVEEIAECSHCFTAVKKLNRSQSQAVRSSFGLQGRIMANLVRYHGNLKQHSF